jgi:hypothetical protein
MFLVSLSKLIILHFKSKLKLQSQDLFQHKEIPWVYYPWFKKPTPQFDAHFNILLIRKSKEEITKNLKIEIETDKHNKHSDWRQKDCIRREMCIRDDFWENFP